MFAIFRMRGQPPIGTNRRSEQTASTGGTHPQVALEVHPAKSRAEKKRTTIRSLCKYLRVGRDRDQKLLKKRCRMLRLCIKEYDPLPGCHGMSLVLVYLFVLDTKVQSWTHRDRTRLNEKKRTDDWRIFQSFYY